MSISIYEMSKKYIQIIELRAEELLQQSRSIHQEALNLNKHAEECRQSLHQDQDQDQDQDQQNKELLDA